MEKRERNLMQTCRIFDCGDQKNSRGEGHRVLGCLEFDCGLELSGSTGKERAGETVEQASMDRELKLKKN
jgi:hypothetical protein